MLPRFRSPLGASASLELENLELENLELQNSDVQSAPSALRKRSGRAGIGLTFLGSVSVFPRLRYILASCRLILRRSARPPQGCFSA